MDSDHNISESQAKQQKAVSKNADSSSDFGSSSTIDAVYGKKTNASDIGAQNRTVLKRMIVRQPSYGQRLSASKSVNQTSSKTSAPISSIPFELRSFLLRRQSSSPQQSIRPFNGFASISKKANKSHLSNQNNHLSNTSKHLPINVRKNNISNPGRFHDFILNKANDGSPSFSDNKRTLSQNRLLPTALEDEEYLDIRVGPIGDSLPIQYKSLPIDNKYSKAYRQITFKHESDHNKYDKLPLLHQEFKGRQQFSDQFYRQTTQYPKSKTIFNQNFIFDSNSGYKNRIQDNKQQNLIEIYQRERPLPHYLIKNHYNPNSAHFDSVNQNQIYSL